MPRSGGRPGRTKWLGLAGALFLAFALPLAAPSAALAYPAYQFSITCQGPGAGQAHWTWYQAGVTGTILANGSAICPTGGGSATGSGVQPASADTLYVVVEASAACGSSTVHVWNFAPGSSISVKLGDTDGGSCGEYKTGGTEKVVFALQS